MAAPEVSVVDVGAGNVRSIVRALQRLGAEPAFASTPAELRAAGRLILPGVGHYENAMSRLFYLGLADALHEAALVRRVPVLGICLGMQLMAKESEEGRTAGLGWLDARVVRLRIRDGSRFKVPQIGWNRVAATPSCRLLAGIDAGAEYYFAHSYVLDGAEAAQPAATTAYEQSFASVLEKGNLFGTQFHPEKSHAAGLAVLRNFMAA